MPVKGSRNTACTKSNSRLAVRRSVATQYCKSSMNSGWKTAIRRGSVFKARRLSEGIDGHGLATPLAGAGQRGQEALGILG